MELWEKVLEAFPELSATDDLRALGIHLMDDADGTGAYIATWTYSEPMPKKFEQYLRK